MASWPIIAPADELTRGAEAMHRDSDFRGVAVFGEPGIGKTTLAHLLADGSGAPMPPLVVQGANELSDVPLGALRHIIPVDDADDAATTLAAAHRTLATLTDHPLLVDDAHRLDPLSVILIHQLAAGGGMQLIVTIGAGVDVPDALTALWKERYLLRVDMSALSLAHTAALLAAALDDVIDDAAVERFHHLAVGNRLLLRRLFTAALENGDLIRKRGRWRLSRSLLPPSDLEEVLGSRLRRLTAPELDVVETIAVAETLEWHTLRETCSVDAVVSAERLGLIALETDRENVVARLAHPLLGVYIANRLDTARVRQLNTSITQCMSLSPSHCDEASRTRLARFMVRSDLPPDLDLITAAAATAVHGADFDTAEELATFAVRSGAGLPAMTVLAAVMSWQRRAGDAEALLASADTGGADESDIVALRCMRAANLFFGFGQAEQARALLDGLRDGGDEPGPAEAVDVAIAFFSGDVAEATSKGLAACASELEPAAMVWAATATVGALGVAGRASEVPAIVGRTERSATRDAEPHRLLLAVSHMSALTLAGDLAAADALQQHLPTAPHSPQSAALVDAMAGRLLMSRGEVVLACDALRKSMSVLSESFPTTWVTLVAAWLTQAEAMAGNRDAVAAAVVRVEDLIGPQAAVFRPELELARAWQQACTGELDSAREHSERAADAARSSGMHAVEAHALHTAVRFGVRSHASRIAELSRRVDGPFAAQAAAHSRALADRDGDHLDEAASAFELCGALALAADAAAQAACEHSRTGSGVKRWRSAARALRLAGRCGLHTPAIAAIEESLDLTVRQRQLADLVGAGLSNREIAERLGVSVRTVESHLSRVFARLGIERREQLVGLALRPQPRG